mmetsp:Transcript_15249/g.40949  ORF Transcript_15249/g.40949 Transcript_15249/m.40949 type:complete len:205 (-) Transcript_15249:1-615(-)
MRVFINTTRIPVLAIKTAAAEGWLPRGPRGRVLSLGLIQGRIFHRGDLDVRDDLARQFGDVVLAQHRLCQEVEDGALHDLLAQLPELVSLLQRSAQLRLVGLGLVGLLVQGGLHSGTHLRALLRRGVEGRRRWRFERPVRGRPRELREPGHRAGRHLGHGSPHIRVRHQVEEEGIDEGLCSLALLLGPGVLPRHAQLRGDALVG